MFLLAIWQLYFVPAVFAQTAFPVNPGGKWGAVDSTGKTVVSPAYDFLSEFNEQGLAIFRKDGKFGLLNASGHEIVPARYQKLQGFASSDLVAFWQNGKCGIMDSKGKELLPAKWQFVSPLNQQLLLLFDSGLYGVAQTDGQVVLSPQYEQINQFGALLATTISKNSKQGLLGAAGKVLLEPVFDEITLEPAQAIATKGTAKTLVRWQKDGNLLLKKEFPNQTALNLHLAEEAAAARKRLLQQNPDASTPRWVVRDMRHTLEDGAGHNLLRGKEFYEVSTDEELGLSLAKESVKPASPQDEEKIRCFLVAYQEPRVLAVLEAKDIIITDFLTGKYARASLDTLRDALTDRQGNLVKAVDGQPFTDIGNFINDRAWVQSGNKFGYINQQAELVIPFDFDVASDFENGYAIARKNGKFGCIDASGKTVLPFEYDGIGLPQNGLCRARMGSGKASKWGVVNLQGKTVVPFVFDLVAPFSGGVAAVQKGSKWGLVNDRGEPLVPPAISVASIGKFQNGIARAGVGPRVEQTGIGPVVRYDKTGYLKKDGTWLLEPVYNRIEGFEQVWAAQQGIAMLVKNGKFGYVNYNGKVTVPAVYDLVTGFDSVWRLNKGIAAVKKDGKSGFIDHNGNEVVPPVFDFISSDFARVWQDSAGWAIAARNNRYGCIDHQGKTVIPFEYDYISETGNGVAIVRHNNLWGAVNGKNDKVLPFEWAGIRFMPGTGQQLLQVMQASGNTYRMTTEGAMAPVTTTTATANAPTPAGLQGFEVQKIFEDEKVALVSKKGNLALTSFSGKLLTKYSFTEAGEFAEGLLAVKVAHKDRAKRLWGYIDATGKQIIAPAYKQAGSFGDGLAAVMSRSTWGYVNRQGQSVIREQFKEAGPFSDGVALVNGQQLINKKGETLGTLQLQGKLVSGFSNGRAVMLSAGGYLHLRADGLPAYFQRYDEVTPFSGETAFVKRGERWQLLRDLEGQELKVNFTAVSRRQYIEAYGLTHSRKMPDGRRLKDKSWQKISDGQWRMIDIHGNFTSEVVFESVSLLEDGSFTGTVPALYGLASLQGKIIAEAVHQIISLAGSNIIKLDKNGQLAYLTHRGEWLWKPDGK